MLPLVETVIAFIVVILLASMLVTAMTQALVAAFNLRGRNLVWGLERLFTFLRAPDAVAKLLSQSVACHRLLTSSSRPPWCYARGLRSGELKDVLSDLAQERGCSQEFNTAVQWLRQKMTGGPEGQSQPGEGPGPAQDAANLLKGLDRWYDMLSYRMSERFAFHSRICSVVCAVAVTVALQLDALGVLQRMAVNEPLRRQAVALAEKVQAEPLREGGNIFEEAFAQATADLNATLPEHQPFLSRGQGEAWIMANTPPGKDAQVLAERYRGAVSNASKASLERNVAKAAELLDQLDALGVELLAWRKRSWSWSMLPGMLMSVGLTSLGAPFWYNLLGQLLSLRSRIKDKAAEERNARQG